MGALVLDIAKVNSHVLPNLDKTTDKLKEASKICSQFLRNLPNSFGYKDRIHQIGDRITKYGVDINNVTIKISEKTEKASTIETKNGSKVSSIVSAAATTALAAAAGAVGGPAAAIGAVAGATAAKKVVKKSDTNIIEQGISKLKNTGAKIAKNVTSFFKKVKDGAKDIVNKIKDACKKIASKVKSFFSDKIAPILNSIWNGTKAVFKFLGKTVATVTTLAVSLVEGVVSFVEAIGDVVLLVVGAVTSIGSLIGDLGKGIFTGEWNLRYTSAVWKKWIMPWVGYDWTSKLFDYAAPVLTLGMDKYAFNWAKRGSTGYKIGKGVGYVAGIIIASVFTAGAAGAASGAAGAAGGAVGGAAGAGTASISSMVSGGLSAVGSLFAGSASATAGTLIPSTVLAGLGKFGQKTQDNYNSVIDKSVKAHYVEQLKLENPTLTDDEINALYDKKLKEGAFKDYAKVRKSAMDNITGGKIAGVVTTSAAQGGIEALTWYMTYGSSLKNADNVFGGKALKDNSKIFKKWGEVLAKDKSWITGTGKIATTANKILPSVNTASFAKAGLQFGKGYANEAATYFIDQDFDISKAHTDAVVGAASSYIYDNTFSAWIKNAADSHLLKTQETAAQHAEEFADSADDIMQTTAQQEIKVDPKTIKLDSAWEYSVKDAGGKKVIGGGIKSILKEIGKKILA